MNWIVLKALNELYLKGEVRKNDTVIKNGNIMYLLNSIKVLEETTKYIRKTPDFNEIYETKYLDNYMKYFTFLEQNELLKPQIRFEESDIEILIKIKSWKNEGVLESLHKQIVDSDESLRGISLMFFKNEKYLDDKISLTNALKKVLDVEHFSNEKDQQYIYKLECYSPTCIILCENLDFLTKPNKPRQYGIELWYAGGKNVDKLKYSDDRGLPIYYLCDWDYDGLFIIYPLVKNKIPKIQLLTPNGKPKGIEETEHNSRWKENKFPIDTLFSDDNHRQLVGKLIQNNQWIIEESNDLLKMLKL